ncbi:MAG: hypothetical protein U0324_36145 [Polyangiales bacterium]
MATSPARWSPLLALLAPLAAGACVRDEWTFRPRDAAPDVASDIAPDGTPDAPVDRPSPDVAVEPPPDVAVDPPPDVGPDITRPDATVNPPPDVADAALDQADADVALDAPPDVAFDAPLDRADAAPDAAPDALPDAAPDVGCGNGATLCGSRCAYLQADRQACGSCSMVCAPTSFCAAGACRAATTVVIPVVAGSANAPRRVALDAQGNAYVLLYINAALTLPAPVGTLSPEGGGDLALLSYTRTGTLRWGFRIGSTMGDDRASPVYGAVQTDDAGNVFVAAPVSGQGTIVVGAGTTTGTGAAPLDGLVAKFNSNGALQWSQVFGGPLEDAVTSLAVARSGDVYVTGALRGAITRPAAVSLPPANTAGGPDLLLAGMRNDTGAVFAARRYGASGATMQGVSIAAATNGDLYVSAVYGGGIPVNLDGTMLTQAAMEPADGLLLRARGDASVAWVRMIGAPGLIDAVGPVAAGAADDVFYAAGFQGTVTFPNSVPTAQVMRATMFDAFVARYDAFGNYAGHSLIATNGQDEVLALARDASGIANALGLAPGTGIIGSTGANPAISPFLLRGVGAGSTATGLTRTGGLAGSLTASDLAFDRYGAVAFVGTSTSTMAANWQVFGVGQFSVGIGTAAWLAIYPRP